MHTLFNVTTTILLLPDAPIDDDIAHDLLEAKLRGRMVVDIRSFYEHVVQRLPISQINDEWLLQTEGFSLNTRGSLRRLKRAFDVLISLVLLVPGLAFDRSGGRLGRGGGYYDRWLAGFSGVTAALCRDGLLMDAIPRLSHDLAVDLVITETGLYGPSAPEQRKSGA